MAKKIYMVTKSDIHRIDGRTGLYYMNSKGVVINKEKVDTVYYINNNELTSDNIDSFWKKRGRKKGAQFTFLKLKLGSPVEIYKDKSADYFDNAKIMSVDEEKIIIRIARVLPEKYFEIQD